VQGSQEKQPTSELHLQPRPAPDQPLIADGSIERGAVVQTPHGAEDLRDTVVGKHGDFVNVPESAEALAVEAGPEVGHEDLGALEKANGFAAAFELVLVAERGEVPCEVVDKLGSRTLCLRNELRDTAVVELRSAVREGTYVLLHTRIGQDRIGMEQTQRLRSQTGGHRGDRREGGNYLIQHLTSFAEDGQPLL